LREKWRGVSIRAIRVPDRYRSNDKSGLKKEDFHPVNQRYCRDAFSISIAQHIVRFASLLPSISSDGKEAVLVQ